MRHYDDTELIELHFLPAENPEARGHVAACDDCGERMRHLAEMLREHAAGPEKATEAKPEFFWERQAVEIRRKTALESKPHHFARFLSIAAMLVLLIGGSFLVSRRQHSVMQTPTAAVATTTASISTHAATKDEILLEELQSDKDAWSTDQLKPYRGAVEWETWLSTDSSSSGGTS